MSMPPPRNVAERDPMFTRLGRGPSLAKLGQGWPISVQISQTPPDLTKATVRIVPKLLKLGQIRQILDCMLSNKARLGKARPEMLRDPQSNIWHSVHRLWLEFDQVRTTLANLSQIRPNHFLDQSGTSSGHHFGQNLPHSAQLGPFLPNFQMWFESDSITEPDQVLWHTWWTSGQLWISLNSQGAAQAARRSFCLSTTLGNP